MDFILQIDLYHIYLLNLIIDDRLGYYMITTGRPAKCLKLRSQLPTVQADDSVSCHSKHPWLGAYP